MKNEKPWYVPFKGTVLLVWFFSCINKTDYFTKETKTFGHIIVWTIYTYHTDPFTPQHTACEQSAACLLVFFESLPGSIPFAILWHTGWILDKNVNMNKNYSYRTTIYKIIWSKCMYFWYYLHFFLFLPRKIRNRNCKNIFFCQKFVHLGEILLYTQA